MKLLSAAALLAGIVSTANALTVNTPASVVQCQPILITWDPEGSAGPFFLSIHDGNNPSGPALFSWDNLTGTSFTWLVTVSSGQSLGLLLRDTTGATSQSAPFTVLAGTTTDCSSSSASGPSSSGPVASSLSSGSTSLPPVSSTSTSLSPVSSPSSTPRPASSSTSVRSSSSSSTSPTSTGSSGGALNNAFNVGSAGFLAALVGAILA